MPRQLERHCTIHEQFYDKPPGSVELVKLWNDDLTNNLLALVWKAYDLLVQTSFLGDLSWDEDYEDLERSITEELERKIQGIMDGFLPVCVQHGPAERESRSKPPAQPPIYDIAFIWNANPRIMWPLEAKVAKSDTDTHANLGDYVDTVYRRYLTCKYAPFSNGGAMISYLKSGSAVVLINNIESLLGCALVDHPTFRNRYHRFSDHLREPPEDKDYPRNFRCHHLVFVLNTGSR